MDQAADQIRLFSVRGGGFAMLTRVILAFWGGVVAVGSTLARGALVACIGFAAGALVVGVGAATAAAAGTAVAAGAVVATGLAVATESLPQATIIAAIPTMSHKGLNNQRL
jgi:hypothetical protein